MCWFYILQLYWIYILILAIFLLEFSKFLYIISCHLQIEKILVLSHLEAFYFFSCLLALVRTSSIMLNKSSNSGHSHVVPDLRAQTFEISLISMILAVVLSYKDFIMLRLVPFTLSLLTFYYERILLFVKCFHQNLLRWLCFYSSIFSCYVLHWLVCRCCWIIVASWNKSQCMNLLKYCWIQFANILLRIFASTFIRNIDL